jgi:uncharacterized repeat protein (TIGR01451 family)
MRSRRATVMLAGAMAALLALGAGWGGAHAAPAAASAAEAYALLVDVDLLTAQVPLDVGPISWAAQEYPPGAANPNETSALEAGPQPADGSVVNHVGVMSAGALADDPPLAGAFAEAADVSLLGGEVSLISADLVRAQSFSNCDEDPTGVVTFENLVVNGQQIENTPEPNTVIELPVANVILNEQHPASDGRGYVVNAVHVVSTTTGDPLFRGDVIVSHAMSTVVCPNGAGSTGGENPIQITKDVAPSSTTAGGQVTYTATFANDAETDCLVTEAIDHLPIGFTLVSTAGDLGDTSATRNRPGGGVDVLVGNGVTIPVGESATQTFVVKVGDNVAPGTYYNDVELFCGNLGNFLKGLDAPVTITAATVPTTTSSTAPPPAGELPETGGSLPVGPILAVLGTGLALALLGRRTQRAAWTAPSSRDL